MNGIEELLINNIAAVVMAGAFLYYLGKKDTMNKDTFDQFNKTIQNHLTHTNKVEKQLAKSLEKFSEAIKGCPYNGVKK